MRTDLYKDILEKEDKHWWHKNKKLLLEGLVKKYTKRKGLKILDIGCGTGMNLEVLKNFGEAWGIDSEKQAIEICKSKGLKKIKIAPAENIPFEDASFSLAVLTDTLEHTDEKSALTEVYRILKPGGLIIITVPAYQWMWSKWDEVLNHKKRYTKKTLGKALKKRGLKIMKISYLYSFLLLPVFFIRKIKSFIYSENYKSDFLITNNFINKILGVTAQLEMNYFLKRNIPFGLSVVAVAKKQK